MPQRADPLDYATSATANERPINAGAWLVLAAAFLGWMFDGLEMGIFPLVAGPAFKELLGTSNPEMIGHWFSYVTAAFLVGAAVGGLVFGWLGDRIGRVRSMALSVLCYSACTGLGFFATHAWHLLVIRFVAALGMGGEWSLGVALVMECWPEAKRPLMAGVIGIASNLGFALIAVLGMIFKIGDHSWRWVMLAGVSPAILTLVINLFVPESEAWKQTVRETGPSRPLRELLAPPMLPITLLAIAFASIALIGTWGSVQWIPVWVDRQLTGGMRPAAKAVAQLWSSMGAIVGSFLGALIAGRWGRRITYFGLCLLSLITCQYLFHFTSYNPTLLVVIFCVGACTAAFYGWLPLYLPEIFPTRMRATGQGLGYNLGRICAAAGALEAGNLVSHYHGSYSHSGATITLIYVLGLILIWFAPETRGKGLPK